MTDQLDGDFFLTGAANWCCYLLGQMNQQRFNDGERCDILIIVNNQFSFPAHSVVLAASSALFNSAIPAIRPCRFLLVLNDTDPLILSHFLDFLYSGKISCDMSQLDDLLNLADKLQVQRLVDAVIKVQKQLKYLVEQQKNYAVNEPGEVDNCIYNSKSLCPITTQVELEQIINDSSIPRTDTVADSAEIEQRKDDLNLMGCVGGPIITSPAELDAYTGNEIIDAKKDSVNFEDFSPGTNESTIYGSEISVNELKNNIETKREEDAFKNNNFYLSDFTYDNLSVGIDNQDKNSVKVIDYKYGKMSHISRKNLHLLRSKEVFHPLLFITLLII